MNPFPGGLPHFCRELEDGRIAFYLDNHLLSTYTECPQKFYYQHIRNLCLKGAGTTSSGPFAIGIWWSKTLELFYKDLSDYQKKLTDREPSEYNLVNAANTAWISCKMSELAEKNPVAYNKFKGEKGAVLMTRQYWERFGELDLKNWVIIAQELGFGYGNEVLLYEDKDMVVYWCGRPDLVLYEKTLDTLVICDHKTKDYLKSNFLVSWKPHRQTAGYVKALQVLCTSLGFTSISIDRCLINGGARLRAEKPKKEQPRFLRVLPHYTTDEIAEFQKQVGIKARNLYESLRTDTWDWRDASCHLYAGCQYRGIDSVTPASREIIIKGSYNQIEPWSYDRREDDEEGTEG